MANKTITMLKLKRIFQLKSQGVSNRSISERLGLARKTVSSYIFRAEQLGLSYDECIRMDESDLSGLLFESEASEQSQDARYHDFRNRLAYFQAELHKPKVTRMILWEEYKRDNAAGYSYSQFCEHLSRYLHKTKAVMRLDHKPGEHLEFDFAGDKLSFVNPETGEYTECSVLVCVLPFSGYTYVEALLDQTREELMHGLNNCLAYIGGIPRNITGDNLKPWVRKAHRYEPSFTEYAQQWSLHYNTNLTATRVKKPRDKASVESHVNVVYRRIYAAIRNETPRSLNELNQLILKHLDLLNTRARQNNQYSRKEMFLLHEKPTLAPLMQEPFVVKHTVKAKVQNNYHVMLGQDKSFYSVPYQHIGSTVTLIYDKRNVEVYYNNQRIATHSRIFKRYSYSTLHEHMPPKHQYYSESRGWDAEYFLKRASGVGQRTIDVVEIILSQKQFIEQNFNSCLGLLRLSDKYGKERLENACKRALTGPKVTYTIVKTILESNLDKTELQQQIPFSIPSHENLRGHETYQ